MRIILLLLILSPLLILQIRTQVTFTESAVLKTTTISNGILVTLSSDSSQPFAHALSDPISVSNSYSFVYITLVCTNTAVNYGLMAKTTGGTLTNLLGNKNTGYVTDKVSVEYPSQLVGTTTSSPIIPDLGHTVGYVLNTNSGKPCVAIVTVGKLTSLQNL